MNEQIIIEQNIKNTKFKDLNNDNDGNLTAFYNNYNRFYAIYKSNKYPIKHAIVLTIVELETNIITLPLNSKHAIIHH